MSDIELRLPDDAFVHLSFHGHGHDDPNPNNGLQAFEHATTITPPGAPAVSTSRMLIMGRRLRHSDRLIRHGGRCLSLDRRAARTQV